MTTRSTKSARSLRDHLTDGDVYVFCLQVALLLHVTKPRPDAKREGVAAASSSSGTGTSSRTGLTPASSTTTSSSTAATSSSREWGFGAITEMLVGASKDSRFPEKLIKRLNERLEKIAMGKDPSYRDQSLRSTIGIFYGQFQNPSFQKQMKENRKVEDLILHFATAAQASLRKRATGDEWKEELEVQVGQFVKIIRESLKLVSGVPRELTDRLEAYSSKLSPKPISLSAASGASVAAAAAASTGGGGALGGSLGPNSGQTLISVRSSSSLQTPTLSTTDAAKQRRDSGASLHSSAGGDPLTESALIRTIGKLFSISDAQLRLDVDSLRKTCTDKAAVADLKRCTANINLGGSWPGRREDFDSEEAWQLWKSAELSTLSKMIMRLCQVNPELLKTTSDGTANGLTAAATAAANRRPSATPAANAPGDDIVSIGRTSPAIDDGGAESDAADTDFTYIPPDPRACYKRVLELCLDSDLEQIRNQEDAEEVSLSILSTAHLELLKECANWWRMTMPFRSLSNLDCIRAKFEAGEAPLECISVALTPVEKSLVEMPVMQWMIQDRHLLTRAYTQVSDAVLRGLYEAFQDVRTADAEEVKSFASLLEELHQSGYVREDRDWSKPVMNLDTHLEDIRDSIRIHAIHEYTAKTTELFSQISPNELVPLVQLIDWIEKGAKSLDRSYPSPLLDSIDPVSLVLEKQVPLFFDDLDSMKRQVLDHALRETDALAADDVFILFHRVLGLKKMFKAFCPDVSHSFEISGWFEPHVHHWLLNTEKKVTEWVASAVRSDRFLPIDSHEAYHSSSIDDLFGALQQPVEFIQTLRWPEKYKHAKFMTTLAKITSHAIEQYCHRVEELFMEEMFPRTAEGQDAQQKQSAWMIKAKQTLQGEKRVEPFHFQPESCVKLNNIEAARILLDKLYARMEADKQAEIVGQHSAEEQEAFWKEKRRFIFTVKIVLGEGLQPINSGFTPRIDSFVTLSDERGNRIAKTRTIYETPEPRWNEVFDIPVEQSMWLAATVWDRKLIGDHALCGRAYLRLDPRYFSDMQSHDLWLDLDTQGKLLLRVSMEGERDDILFHFGRAFRSLKRAEGDMVRIIVDKMSIFIRHCLSRQVLRSLVKTSGIDLNKAIVNVKALYNTALASTNGSASMIPPVESEATRNRSKTQQLTDAEIEEAITPLLDYLDECLSTLKSSLSENQALVVLSKVWKEVLNIIEGILLPPLSDAPTDMKQLSEKEVDIVFKWLTFLRNYFNAYDEETGVAGGVPLETLQNSKYREILQYLLWHDSSTDSLMEECARSMQQSLRKQAGGQLSKSKSVYNQRSLGTIKKRKQDKKKEEDAPSNEVLVMKLLRMRPGTQDFLASQMRMKAQLSAMTTAHNHKDLGQAPERQSRQADGFRSRPRPPLPPK